jgi:anaerobic dimethyl sulfoxide reductase subunit B (iron-sulfur subunit)
MKMAKQLAFYFNASACANCKACQIACQDKNNLPAEIRWRRVLQYGGGGWVPSPDYKGVMVPANLFAYSVSISCMHCEEPMCLMCCPVKGIEKHDNGVVVINEDECIGCRYCEWACPYGAPHFNEELNQMTKCNFCEDLLAKGENPACVDACVMRALDFGELDELRAKYGELDAIEPLPSSDITHPALVVTPHKDSQMSGNGTGKIMNLEEEL